MAQARLQKMALTVALGAALGIIALASCGTATATNPTAATGITPQGRRDRYDAACAHRWQRR